MPSRSNTNASHYEHMELQTLPSSTDAEDTAASRTKSRAQQPIGRAANTTPIDPHGQAKHRVLGSLPHEVLVNILRHAMVADEQPLELRGRVGSRYRLPDAARLRDLRRRRQLNAPSTALGLLLVNRRFYIAGTEAYYGSNSLSFANVAAFKAFLSHIGSERKLEIRSIALPSRWCFSVRKQFWPYPFPQEGSPGYLILPASHDNTADTDDHIRDAAEALDLIRQHTPLCRNVTLVIRPKVAPGKHVNVPQEVQDYISDWLRQQWQHPGFTVFFVFPGVEEATAEEIRRAWRDSNWRGFGGFNIRHRRGLLKFLVYFAFCVCGLAAFSWYVHRYAGRKRHVGVDEVS